MRTEIALSSHEFRIVDMWRRSVARYCASDDEEEIQSGLAAVLETLSDNYVRPNEANKAQSMVATRGQHRFIDKVHVNYVEKDKRHWAALETKMTMRALHFQS